MYASKLEVVVRDDVTTIEVDEDSKIIIKHKTIAFAYNSKKKHEFKRS